MISICIFFCSGVDRYIFERSSKEVISASLYLRIRSPFWMLTLYAGLSFSTSITIKGFESGSIIMPNDPRRTGGVSCFFPVNAPIVFMKEPRASRLDPEFFPETPRGNLGLKSRGVQVMVSLATSISILCFASKS